MIQIMMEEFARLSLTPTLNAVDCVVATLKPLAQLVIEYETQPKLRIF